MLESIKEKLAGAVMTRDGMKTSKMEFITLTAGEVKDLCSRITGPLKSVWLKAAVNFADHVEMHLSKSQVEEAILATKPKKSGPIAVPKKKKLIVPGSQTKSKTSKESNNG